MVINKQTNKQCLLAEGLKRSRGAQKVFLTIPSKRNAGVSQLFCNVASAAEGTGPLAGSRGSGWGPAHPLGFLVSEVLSLRIKTRGCVITGRERPSALHLPPAVGPIPLPTASTSQVLVRLGWGAVFPC